MYLIAMPGVEDKQAMLPFDPTTMKIGRAALEKRDDKTLTPVKAKRIHTNKPKVIKILLGSQCNFRCQYCRQFKHDIKDPNTKFNKNHEKLLRMIEDNLDLSRLERVEYWGGEPLLYWDAITELADQIQHMIPLQKIKHHVTTNGWLLDEDKANYIADRHFLFKLSHDGPGQNLRTKDPLKSNARYLHEFLYEHMKSDPDSKYLINSVMTAMCPSPKQIVEYFRKAFDDEIQVMKIEPVIPYNDDALRYAIGLSKMQEFENTLYDDILNGDIVRSVQEYQNLFELFTMQTQIDDYKYNPTENKCHASQEITICTDIYGNITPCQVYNLDTPDNIIGHLEDLDNLREVLPFAPETREKCKDCEVVSLCRGVCSYIQPGKYADTNCIVRYHTYRGILRAFMQMRYGFEVADFVKE